MDWDQNGTMDLFMNYDANGHQSVVLKGIEGDELAFEHMESGIPSVYWQQERTKFFADMNGDDVMDILKQAFSQTGMKEAVAESVKGRVSGKPLTE